MILSIVVPVFNEVQTIDKVLDEVINLSMPTGWNKEIIVVDDGSFDGTAQRLAKRSEFRLITKENGGKGSAVKAGFNLCTGDYIIVKDADLEQRSEDIIKLLDYAIKHKSNFLIGSRFSGAYQPKTHKMRLHQIVNSGFGLVVGLLVGKRIDDVWSGYKLLSKKSLDIIKNRISKPSIEFELEMLLIASKHKINIDQIPINYNPRWYKEGKKTSYKHAIKSMGYLCLVVIRGIK